jgi:hypothetical protein
MQGPNRLFCLSLSCLPSLVLFLRVSQEPVIEWNTLKVLYSDRLAVLLANIGLVWKGLLKINALAYLAQSKIKKIIFANVACTK